MPTTLSLRRRAQGREHDMSDTADKTGPQPVVTDTDDVFGTWQPRYAARGIATVPIKFAVDANGKLDKKPLVQHWMKMGVRASTQREQAEAEKPKAPVVSGDSDGTLH
jgi:hypothetical protein